MHSSSEKGTKIVSFQKQTDEENLRKKKWKACFMIE